MAMAMVERVWYHGCSARRPGEDLDSIKLDEVRGDDDELDAVDEVSDTDAVLVRATTTLLLGGSIHMQMEKNKIDVMHTLC